MLNAHLDVFALFLKLDHLYISILLLAEVFNGFQYSLYNLDLSGKENSVVSLQDLRQMRNMRFLSISRIPESTLSPDNFMEYGMDIKELRIVKSNLNTIKSHAFMHVRGIKYLDFSENSISTIEDEAFSEVIPFVFQYFLSKGFGIQVYIYIKWYYCMLYTIVYSFFLNLITKQPYKILIQDSVNLA